MRALRTALWFCWQGEKLRDSATGSELSELQRDSLKLMESVRDESDPIKAITGNPEFVSQVKALCSSYLRDAVVGAKIPDLAGKKDWGTYELSGLVGHAAACICDTTTF